MSGFWIPWRFVKVFTVAVYDDTLFCDIGFVGTAPLLLPASDTLNGDFVIREDRGIRIDYTANDSSRRSTIPRQVVLTLRRKR